MVKNSVTAVDSLCYHLLRQIAGKKFYNLILCDCYFLVQNKINNSFNY